MKHAYIYFTTIVFYVSYAAETSSFRARPRPTPLQTPTTSKRLSGNFSSPRGFASPKGNQASPCTPKTNDSASSSPGDAAAYTQTIIPDLHNRIQGYPQLLEKGLADYSDGHKYQEYSKRILDLINTVNQAHEELLSLAENNKLEYENERIAKRLGRKKIGELSQQERIRVNAMIEFFKSNIDPRLKLLEYKYQALRLTTVKQIIKRVGSA